MTILWPSACSRTAPSCSWMNPYSCSFGMNSSTQSTVSASDDVVGAAGQLLDLAAHVLQEVVAVPALLELGFGVEVPQVVVERELHVHVEHDAARQQEREVRDARPAGDGGLLPVLDAFDEPGELQHVLGHPLTPLAAGLAAGERLAQPLGRLGELGEALTLLAQHAVEDVELRAPLGLELLEQVGDAGQLVVHVRRAGCRSAPACPRARWSHARARSPSGPGSSRAAARRPRRSARLRPDPPHAPPAPDRACRWPSGGPRRRPPLPQPVGRRGGR